jgi:Phosphate ATP-binding cassette transporter
MLAACLLAVAAATVAAYVTARQHAWVVAGGKPSALHSLPSYHRLLATDLAGTPLVGWLAGPRALEQFPTEATADPLHRAARGA